MSKLMEALTGRLKIKNPLMNMSGLKFIKYNRPKITLRRILERGPTCKIYLAATHAVTAIEAFIAGSAADGNMSAGITGRGIALHALRGCIDGI